MILGRAKENLANRVTEMLSRMLKRGSFVAAHETAFFRGQIMCCSIFLSGSRMRHDQEHVQGLKGLKQPSTAREQQQVLQAVN